MGETARAPAVHSDVDEIDVVVIGAGQAGLSSAYYLRRFGYEPLVLDAADGPGGAWRHRSPTLTMDKVHGIFDLPGIRRDPNDDRSGGSDSDGDRSGGSDSDGERSGGRDPGDGRSGGCDSDGGRSGGRPAAEVVPAYYGDYERRLGLRVVRPVKVAAVARAGERLVVTADTGQWASGAVVNATGTWTRPYWPHYPGARDFRGRQLHYADLSGAGGVRRAPGGRGGRRALGRARAVGARRSRREHAWVTRSPPAFRDAEFERKARRAAVARVEERVRAGLLPQSVVSVTGLGYTTLVRRPWPRGRWSRLPMFERITPDGVRWADGTAEPPTRSSGRPASAPRSTTWRRCACASPGGGIKRRRHPGRQGAAAAARRLRSVGQHRGANRAGRTAAENIRRFMTGGSPASTAA